MKVFGHIIRQRLICAVCGGPRTRKASMCLTCRLAKRTAGRTNTCACGARKDPRAQQCAACLRQVRKLAAGTRPDSRKRLCACGVWMWRTSRQCRQCRTHTGYNIGKGQVLPRTGQDGLTLFLMQQRHRVQGRVERMEQRIYRRKEADEITLITPIVIKRESLDVQTQGNCQGHWGGKCGSSS